MKSIFKKEDYMMNENWLGLDGQVVIVTGGASGIGKHVVDTLVKVGANAVAVDLNVKMNLTALTVYSVMLQTQKA